MKSTLLLKIRDAETAVADRVATARDEAANIVSAARKEAEALLSDGRDQADHGYAAALDAARAEGDEAAKKVLANGKRQATNLQKRFDEGADAAVERIVAAFEESL